MVTVEACWKFTDQRQRGISYTDSLIAYLARIGTIQMIQIKTRFIRWIEKVHI